MSRARRATPDATAPIPHSVGPVLFSRVGSLFAVRAPRDDPEILAALRRARATWDKGTKQWWIRAERAERLVADLRVIVDPLFRALR